MTFGFYTLGCKTNQFETQAMEQLLRSLGHETAPFEEKCDGYIINTCSVTAVADKKNRAVIRRCRRENPDALIAVCGCYPQHDAPSVRALGVDVVGGSAQREEFIRQVLQTLQDRQKRQVLDEALRRHSFELLAPGALEGRTRAMLKVQDGCTNFCSYCIIPYTRGPVRSLPVREAAAQAAALKAAHFREIVLTGIEIAGWGRDLPGKPPLTDLVEAIAAAAPGLRLRLGSLEPRVVTEEFCRKLSKIPGLCPHFHLSLQSGCDTVLKRMNRKYDTARYLHSCTLLREFFPGCAITTDLIVAFPGETEEEHRQSLQFIRECAFADMHIFPYSRRPGTPADKMSGQLGNAVKEARSREAIAAAAEMKENYLLSQLDTVQSVLFEEKEGPYFTGHTPNYTKVYFQGEDLHNRCLPIKLTRCHKDGILGQEVSE